MTSEPTPGEVMRRLDEVARQLSEVARQMADDRKHASETYVRKDVYEANTRAAEARHDELVKDVGAVNAREESDRGFKRQVLLWGAGLTITTLISLASNLVQQIR